MKQISSFLIFCIVMATGCSKSNKDLLVGTWTTTKATYTLPTQSPQDIPNGIGKKFTFNACSSTCTGSTNFPGIDSVFTYSLSDDGKKFINDGDTMNILELTSSKFTFSGTAWGCVN
ncbi:MAG: hypothetical protein IPK03_02860 [Bacteroidetes bacterium]|nr:hypothetical protein [Bacteroidota bacterium]